MKNFIFFLKTSDFGPFRENLKIGLEEDSNLLYEKGDTMETNNSTIIEGKIPTLSVGDTVKELVKLYAAVIKAGIPIKKIPAPFLWGPPGVGKSDGIRQIAAGIEEKTGKKVIVTDVRLLLFSPIDLRGVPVADKNKEFTDWLKPRIFDMDPSEDVVNILFLDELSAAPQSVQAAAYQITLDRVIGEHKLPDNCIVAAAGNRVTDRSVAFRMPNALANRLCHFDVCVDFDSWKDWAEKNNINSYVLGYLSFDRSKLYAEKIELDQVAFTTPRSWEFVSNILNVMQEGDDISDYYNLISSCIGKDVAIEFVAWAKTYNNIPNLQDIFAGNTPDYPKKADELHALITAISNYAISRAANDTHKLTETELCNAVKYASKFPEDYKASLYLNLCSDNTVKLMLLKIQEFKDWMRKTKIEL